MHHVILGYGYCGYYLAQKLLQQGQQVTAISRHLDQKMMLPKLNHLTQDLNHPFDWYDPTSIVYYLIPPPSDGEEDSLLKLFLNQHKIIAKKIIYFGSSGVYGDHQGDWVNEQSECKIKSPRQLRRLDAERQWQNYCQEQAMDCVILRIAGIYGPDRLPIEAAKAQTPLIEPAKAPYSNHIYVEDLADIACSLSQSEATYPIYNVADGEPQPMGTLQQLVASHLNLPPAPFESWDQAMQRASPMKKEFMQASKKLSINRLKSTLLDALILTPMNEAIRLG